MPVCKNCGSYFPSRPIIDGKPRNLSRRSYCLECSPFGEGSRKQLVKREKVTKPCELCGREKDDNRKLCAPCTTKIRRTRTKIAAINYLGGKCIRCGWNEHISGFQFHHRDPNLKEFEIGDMANKSWATIKQELDKCDLLCSNCHIITHSTRDTEEVMKHVNNYQGKLLNG